MQLPVGPGQVLHDEGLAEGDGGRLEEAAAPPAVRVVLTRSQPVEHGLHGAAIAAVQAHRLPHGAVELDDQGRIGAGQLVQAVDVLGEENEVRDAALELGECLVTAIGGRLPYQLAAPSVPLPYQTRVALVR